MGTGDVLQQGGLAERERLPSAAMGRANTGPVSCPEMGQMLVNNLFFSFPSSFSAETEYWLYKNRHEGGEKKRGGRGEHYATLA